MSLFKSRPFWTVLCDVDEKFDQNSLEVSRINDECDRIVIGSHSGILRIYQPSTEIKQDNVLSEFQPSDLLIEKIFSDPILQISTGRLVSGSTKLYVAVLYPKSVAVYGLVTREGATEHGTQNMLPLIYEHKLKRSAANFCLGPFGGVQTRDFICIQSLDGLLTFFEQESFAFCCFLPEFLLPGPLIYVHKSDSFVTVSSSWHLTSFKYKNLSEAGHNSHDDDNTGTRVKSFWSYNLGEEVIQLQYTVDCNNIGYIVALGTRNLYCLTENGVARFMKRLDFTPICFFVYTLGDTDNTVWSLIASETNTLLVYLNTTLKWAAQLPTLPIAIKRGFFKNAQGALVFLTDDGQLNCSYLGTEPHLFSTTPLVHQELDYEKAEAELLSLTKIIGNYYSSNTKLINSTAEKEVQISLTVNPYLNPDQSCQLSVTLTPNVILEEVQVTATVSQPLKCTNAILFCKNLSSKAVLETKVYVDEPLPCPSLKVDIVASCMSNLGVPKVLRKTVDLPLKMLVISCDTIKESKRKVVLGVDKEGPALSQLYPEFFYGFTSTSNKLGLKSNNESCDFSAAVIASGNEYHVSSDCLPALNVVVSDLISRLKVQEYVANYKNPLPTTELFVFIRRHFGHLQIVKNLQTKLNLLSGQFRVIQKKLISKFKDRNPTSLSNMEMLLEETYMQIINFGTQLETEIKNLTKTQVEVSCLLNLFSTLIYITDVDKNIIPILETAFCSFVHDIENQSWEDVLETSLCYLLQTILSRTEGEKLKMTTLEEVKDVEKLELHISQVVDRIKQPNAVFENVNDCNKSEAEVEHKDMMPVGSKFGEYRPKSSKKHVLKEI